MLPQHFVQLDGLPLLPNGKVNRQALPAPEASMAPAPDHVSPRSETETILAGIWSEVLGVDRVGVHDSFFDLGGHSLLALKLSHRIEQQFKRTIRLATLFDAPTVSRLAMLLSGEALDEPQTCAVGINAGGRRAPLFFVSGWAAPSWASRRSGANCIRSSRSTCWIPPSSARKLIRSERCRRLRRRWSATCAGSSRRDRTTCAASPRAASSSTRRPRGWSAPANRSGYWP